MAESVNFQIFICTFDPFKDGRHIYSFENICRENTSIVLGDETAKIFLNTRGTINDVDEDMKEFLTYVENTSDAFARESKSPLIKEIHRKVAEVKQSKEMEVEYMTLLQRDREKQEEGALQAAKIIRLYNKGLSSMEIAASLNLSIDYIEEIINSYESE